MVQIKGAGSLSYCSAAYCRLYWLIYWFSNKFYWLCLW